MFDDCDALTLAPAGTRRLEPETTDPATEPEIPVTEPETPVCGTAGREAGRGAGRLK